MEFTKHTHINFRGELRVLIEYFWAKSVSYEKTPYLGMELPK